MGLGWGKVAASDWQKLATGGRQDMVPAADYFATPHELVHFGPEKNDKGLGTYVIRHTTTVENEEQWRDKTLETRCMYHPNPDASDNADGYTKMNEISLGKMAAVVEACGGTQVIDPADGAVDVIASLQGVIGSGKVLMGTVSKGTYEGREQQTFDSFRAVA